MRCPAPNCPFGGEAIGLIPLYDNGYAWGSYKPVAAIAVHAFNESPAGLTPAGCYIPSELLPDELKFKTLRNTVDT
jgi:hypothetical protein